MGAERAAREASIAGRSVASFQPSMAKALVDQMPKPATPPESSGARMRPKVTVAQAMGRNVGVDLRRRKTPVTEQLLHAANVRPAIEQVCGKAVPDRVRAGAWIEAGLLEILFHE